MHCLGCGDSLDDTTRKRNLDNPSNADVQAVVSMWKSLMSCQNLDEGIDLEAILTGFDRNRPPKMCRPCFLAYKKHYGVELTLQEKLKQAVDSLNLSTTPPSQAYAGSESESSDLGELELLRPVPPAKRVRLSDNPSTSSSSINLSPAVEVNNND